MHFCFQRKLYRLKGARLSNLWLLNEFLSISWPWVVPPSNEQLSIETERSKKLIFGITAAVWHLRLIPNCSSPSNSACTTLNSLITGMMWPMWVMGFVDHANSGKNGDSAMIIARFCCERCWFMTVACSRYRVYFPLYQRRHILNWYHTSRLTHPTVESITEPRIYNALSNFFIRPSATSHVDSIEYIRLNVNVLSWKMMNVFAIVTSPRFKKSSTLTFLHATREPSKTRSSTRISTSYYIATKIRATYKVDG